MTSFGAGSDGGKRIVFGVLIGYFVLQTLLRVALSNSLELDEAGQLVLTQELHWVYSSDPPLYNWLQAGVFALLGVNVFALAATKNCILFLTYFFTYLSAKELTGDRRAALAAMLSLLLLPAIAWGSQRTLTHSVLLTSVAAATLWVFIRLLKTGARRYYVGFGLCIGLGMLSKYNYAIVLLPMVLAALSTARFRSRIGSSRIFLSGLAFAAVFGPHLQAALTLPEATLGRVDQLHLGQAVSHFEAGIRGIGSLLEGFVAHTVVLALVYVLLFLRAPHVVSDSAETPRRGDFETLLRRTLVFGLLAVAGVLVLFKIPSITTRWLQPLVVIVPVYAVVVVRKRMDVVRFRRLCLIAAAAALLVVVMLIGRVALKPLYGDPVTLNAPFEAFAAQLREQGFDGGVIASDDHWVAGGLKLFFPDSVALTPELFVFAAPTNRSWLLAWEPRRGEGIPAELISLVERKRGPLADYRIERLEAAYQYDPSGAVMNLNVAILSGRSGR